MPSPSVRRPFVDGFFFDIQIPRELSTLNLADNCETPKTVNPSEATNLFRFGRGNREIPRCARNDTRKFLETAKRRSSRVQARICLCLRAGIPPGFWARGRR